MNTIIRDAIIKAGEIRKQLEVDMFQPINIFDSCIQLGMDVRFVDVNMEGLYIKQDRTSTILISNKRPLPRRCFTCGHELGHHIFNHGMKVDILSDESGHSTSKDSDEILVDAFSAALLMPVGGVLVEFANRNWNIHRSKPINFYTISSIFGVGYQTLVTHCRVNNLISESHSASLLKWTPAKIFKYYFSKVSDKSYFRIIDENSNLSVIDIEVSNYLILPFEFQTECFLEKILDTEFGYVYKAKKAGIFPVHSSDGRYSFFIRIQSENYIGFAEYRHFEN